MTNLNFEDSELTITGPQQHETYVERVKEKRVELVTIDKKDLIKYRDMFNIEDEVFNLYCETRSSRHIKMVYHRYLGDICEEDLFLIVEAYIKIYYQLEDIKEKERRAINNKYYNESLAVVEEGNDKVVTDNVRLRKELEDIKITMQDISSANTLLEESLKKVTSLLSKIQVLKTNIKKKIIKQTLTNKSVKDTGYTLTVVADTTQTVYFNTGSGIPLVAKKVQNGKDDGLITIYETFTLNVTKENMGYMSNNKLDTGTVAISSKHIEEMGMNELLHPSIVKHVANKLDKLTIKSSNNKFTITTSTMVSIYDFDNRNDMLDLPLQGITLSLNKPVFGRAIYQTESHTKGISFSAYVHDTRIKKLYTTISGEIFEIKVNHNVDEEERVDLLLGDGDTISVFKTLTLDELETNNIYLSEEKAMLFKNNIGIGDIKERIALATAELSKRKQEAIDKRLETESENNVLRVELEKNKAELEIAKLKATEEREVKKDRRSSWKDLINVAVGIVGLLTSTMVLVSKYVLPYV